MSPAVTWLYVDDDSTTSPHTHYINPSRPNGYYLYHYINMNKFYILPTEFVHVSVSFSQWKVFFFVCVNHYRLGSCNGQDCVLCEEEVNPYV